MAPGRRLEVLQTMGILWLVSKGILMGVGMICSVAVLGVGVLTVAALLMGSEEEEDDDPTDEAGEVREWECRQMALGLSRGYRDEVDGDESPGS